MRNGIKVYDTDTHVGASAEALEPYLDVPLAEIRREFGIRVL